MSKPILRGIAAAFLGIALVFGCAGPRFTDQIGFGIWAADRDLWDEAIFRWKKVLSQEPRSVAAHNNLAVAFEKKGLWEEARKEYEAALKLDPDNPWVKLNYEKFRNNLEPDKKDKEKEPDKSEKK
ncbi:MAG: tetratricopeptide repeat protein [Candidatus Aminicenantales bacterium]